MPGPRPPGFCRLCRVGPCSNSGAPGRARHRWPRMPTEGALKAPPPRPRRSGVSAGSSPSSSPRREDRSAPRTLGACPRAARGAPNPSHRRRPHGGLRGRRPDRVWLGTWRLRECPFLAPFGLRDGSGRRRSTRGLRPKLPIVRAGESSSKAQSEHVCTAQTLFWRCPQIWSAPPRGHGVASSGSPGGHDVDRKKCQPIHAGPVKGRGRRADLPPRSSRSKSSARWLIHSGGQRSRDPAVPLPTCPSGKAAPF
jgi:hypothetical protein